MKLNGHWMLDEHVLHLNHGSFGATPRSVLEAQQRIRDRLETNPTNFFLGGDYQRDLDAARRALANFLSADEHGLVFVENATSGVNAVLRSLEARLVAGDEILVTDHGYNAFGNAAVVSANRTGAKLVTANVPFPLESTTQVTQAVVGAITERTRILIIDAVTSPTALMLPVAEIVAELEPDVRVLVDAAHAPGMLDFNVSSIGASYVTANCHKWLCSPKGAGFLWVREDRREDVYPTVISNGYNGGWSSGGGRLHSQFDWTGTQDPSAWLTVPDAIDAVAAMHPEGWPGVRRAIRELCLSGRRILLDALGIDAPAPDDMIGAIASVPLPPAGNRGNRTFDPLMAELADRYRIQVPVFAWPPPLERLLRISAHLYNDESHYHRLAEALAELLDRHFTVLSR